MFENASKMPTQHAGNMLATCWQHAEYISATYCPHAGFEYPNLVFRTKLSSSFFLVLFPLKGLARNAARSYPRSKNPAYV